MAFMNQEKKAAIRVELKKVMPTGWKWTLGVRHHSTIVLNISKGPRELIGCTDQTYIDLNTYHIDKQYPDNPEIVKQFENILTALNLNNFDKSDSQSDYFHVGHYVDVNIGKWDKPYQCN